MGSVLIFFLKNSEMKTLIFVKVSVRGTRNCDTHADVTY